jgi:feruloyl esterase
MLHPSDRGLLDRIITLVRDRLFKVALAVICSTELLAQQAPKNKCERLQSLQLRNTIITAVAVVPEAQFALPTSATSNKPSLDLPSYCRVTATIRPTPNSDIGIELWMPTSQWNEKVLGTGNVNWCGGVNQLQMALGLREHYAVVGTDRGHKSCAVDGSFALNPDKMADFGYRAVHEMTVAGKQLVANYYAIAPKHSYFSGGSSGGGEALMEAQRYPEDYDGIVAGAPTNYWTHLMAASLWNAQIARVLSRAKLNVLHDAVVRACDSPDAIGLLDDPRQCQVDPASLLCSDNRDSPDCLTQTEVDAAKQIYAGPTNPHTGELIYPGLERGSELGWPVNGPLGIHVDYFRNVVHGDPNWDWHTFDLERDVALGDEKGQRSLNAVDVDLSRFVARGGKLILWHGWSDPLLAPRNTINYYEGVSAKIGRRTQDSIRLFMIPRIGHNGGGRGTDQFNTLAALDRWVESNLAPDRITAQHVTGIVGAGPGTGVTMERPLCAYPQVARWKGSGSANDAANFECAAVRGQR